MRYLILAAAGVVSLIFTGAVFPVINIADIAPDFIICVITSVAVLEKSMTGAVIGLVCGLILDLLFSGVIGLFALPYLVTGAVLYFVMQRMNYMDPVLLPTLFAMGAYLLKELVSALLAYMIGQLFSLGHMLVRFMLPEALATGIFMLLIHFIFRRIYGSPSMKPAHSEDFKRL